MKIKYTIIALVLSCFALSSCIDFLVEKGDPDHLTPDKFWKTELDIKKGLTAAYAALQPSQSWGAPFERFIVIDNYRSDESHYRADVPEWIQIANYTNETGNYIPNNEWIYLFKGINYSNQCILNIPKIEGVKKEVADMGISEARFLRAYYYFRLLMNYGDMLPLLKTPIEGNEDEFYPPQSETGVIQAFIESELLAVQAADMLPNDGFWGEEDAGRATKSAAAGILAKYYMFTKQEAKAEVELKKIIDGGYYELLGNYNDLFNGLNKNSKEAIFEVQYSGHTIGGNREHQLLALHLAPLDLGGYEESYPSKWLFETMKNDKTVDGKYSQRLYTTILFDDPNTEYFLFKEGQKFSDVLPDDKIFWHKFNHFDPSLGSGSWDYYNGLNIPILRYADVLLLYAECLNDKGNSAEAINYINMVRSRSNLVLLGTGMSKDQVLKHLQDVERPSELAFEGSRWYDLIRWGIVEQALTIHQKPFASNFRIGKYTLFPIPHDEFLLNPEWSQNPNFSK